MRATIVCVFSALIVTVVGRTLYEEKLERLIKEIESELSYEEIRSPTDREAPISRPLGETSLVSAGFQYRPFLIGAFNVQIFGDTKFAKEEVVQSLLLTISRYDVLLFQEIRDTDENSFPAFMVRLNNFSYACSEYGNAFSYVVSERLGRSNSKEQYAYIYRTSLFTLVDTYQYPDIYDKYERPPYGIVLKSTDIALPGEFGFLGVHTKPDAAETEIDALVDVYEVFKSTFEIQDVVMMGDFNADCSYVTGREWPDIRLRNDPSFLWLVGDDADTTTSATECAYDRVVLAGSQMKRAVVPNSASVYRFDLVQGLNEDETLDVSDHYPIEFLIYGQVDPAVADIIDVRDTISISGENALSDHAEILDALEELDMLYTDISDELVLAELYEVSDVIGTLTDLFLEDDRVIPEVLLLMAETYIEDAHALEDFPHFPGVILPDDLGYNIQLEVEAGHTKILISKIAA